jgi:hypothetical protein
VDDWHNIEDLAVIAVLRAKLAMIMRGVQAPVIEGEWKVAGEEAGGHPLPGLHDGQSRPHVGTEIDMRTRLPAEVALSELPARSAGRRVGMTTHRHVPSAWLRNAGLSDGA